MSALRRTSLHRALHRPNLILGGERELVLISAILCGGVAVSGLNAVSVIIAVGVWLVTVGFLQMMAKTDSHLSKVYLRYLRYRPYYAARSRPFRKE
jgi:type IV secretion system protein VirB3